MKRYVIANTTADGTSYVSSVQWQTPDGKFRLNHSTTTTPGSAKRYSAKESMALCEVLGNGLTPVPFVEKSQQGEPNYAVRETNTSALKGDEFSYVYVGQEEQCREFSAEARRKRAEDATPGSDRITYRVVRINRYRPGAVEQAMEVLRQQRLESGEALAIWSGDRYACGEWASADGTCWFSETGAEADKFNRLAVTLTGGPRDGEVVA